ncbi:TPA: hypothetical protein O2E65_001544 [Listeria monocytogenes]|uniref:hypothetical protein n=1 Tax=Listeria monocytogenes TaxID=1639 RepID=UPI001650318A|nr:hypothetical protein [Listeria monocytogenes]EIL9238518.1 hypothetical protein [Listeria monocytogenes]HCY9071803.1 hypothetical protein [Listeria monocytogenes]
MNRKRYTVRFPVLLAKKLEETAKNRGMSVNTLVTELCWKMIDDFNKAFNSIDNE